MEIDFSAKGIGEGSLNSSPRSFDLRPATLALCFLRQIIT